jgi:hypothetical protein
VACAEDAQPKRIFTLNQFNMKRNVLKRLADFVAKTLGNLFDVADRYADAVVVAVEKLQGILDKNADKLESVTARTKTKIDDKALALAMAKLPEVLKGVKEAAEILDGNETDEEIIEAVRAKLSLPTATDRRRFYTDVAAGLLQAVVSKRLPDWLTVILVQWAFGRVFKA